MISVVALFQLVHSKQRTDSFCRFWQRKGSFYRKGINFDVFSSSSAGKFPDSGRRATFAGAIEEEQGDRLRRRSRRRKELRKSRTFLPKNPRSPPPTSLRRGGVTLTASDLHASITSKNDSKNHHQLLLHTAR